MLLLLLLLLATLANFIFAAPVKQASESRIQFSQNEHHNNPNSSSSGTNIPPATVFERQMSEDVRTRLYHQNKFDADGRKMSRQEWEEMVKKNPALEARMEYERRRKNSVFRRRNYLRRKVKNNPGHLSKYIEIAKNDGFKAEDLIPKRPDKSPQGLAKVMLIRAELNRLRKEIASIGTGDRKRYHLRPWGRAAREIKQREDNKIQDLSMEEQLLDEIGKMRAALQEDPYDARIFEVRDRVHSLMKRCLQIFHPIKLPFLEQSQSRLNLSDSMTSTSQAAVASPSEQSKEPQAARPSLEKLLSLSRDEKMKYIESLFH